VSLSSPVLDLLQQSSQLAYMVTGDGDLDLSSAAGDHRLVRSLLLRNGQVFVQVLLQSDSILDLDAMYQQFGRHFDAVPPHEVYQNLANKQLATVPAVPHWQNMPTFVDQNLLQKDTLLLDAGDGRKLVQINQENFVELIKDCQIGVFTHPAPEMPEPADDEARIIDSVTRFTEKRIRQRLEETLELPPLPETASRIIRLRADPEADISDLTNIVEIDPSLAAQVVSWAASPYYSAPGKIKSVHDAIVRVLGFDMVLNLALGLALGNTLNTSVINREEIQQFWRNAVYTAAAVEGLVTNIPREHRPSFGMAYLSGLLNNFGQLILAEVFPPHFKIINRAVAANAHLANSLVETDVMGVSGNQIAAWLLENWNLPTEVTVALRQQSNPQYRGEHATYSKLNFVARQLLSNVGLGAQLPNEIPAKVFEDLNLSPDQARQTLQNILESADDLDAIAEKMRS